MEFDTHELAWCSGLFDGEGHVSSHINNGGRSNFYLSVSQNDTRILDRFRNAVGYGRIRQSSDVVLLNGERSLGHVLYAQKFEEIQFIMCLIWKRLDIVKREQYKKAVIKHLSLCWKPSFDSEAVRKRDSHKYGSVAMQRKRQQYLDSLNKDPNPKPFVNPFLKLNESNSTN